MATPREIFNVPPVPPPLPEDWEFPFTSPDDTQDGVRGLVPALPQLPAGRTANEFSIAADSSLVDQVPSDNLGSVLLRDGDGQMYGMPLTELARYLVPTVGPYVVGTIPGAGTLRWLSPDTGSLSFTPAIDMTLTQLQVRMRNFLGIGTNRRLRLFDAGGAQMWQSVASVNLPANTTVTSTLAVPSLVLSGGTQYTLNMTAPHPDLRFAVYDDTEAQLGQTSGDISLDGGVVFSGTALVSTDDYTVFTYSDGITIKRFASLDGDDTDLTDVTAGIPPGWTLVDTTADDFTPPDDTQDGVRGLVPALPQLANGRTADEFAIRADGQLAELPDLTVEVPEYYVIQVGQRNAANRMTYAAIAGSDGATNVSIAGQTIILPSGKWRITANIFADDVLTWTRLKWKDEADQSDMPLQAYGHIAEGLSGDNGSGAPALTIVDGPIVINLHSDTPNLLAVDTNNSQVFVEKVRSNLLQLPTTAQQGSLATPAADEWLSSQDVAALQPPPWYQASYGQVTIPLNSVAAVAFGNGVGKYQIWLTSDGGPAGQIYHELHIEKRQGSSFYLGMPATSKHQAPTFVNDLQTTITDNSGGWADSSYTVNNANGNVSHTFASATGRTWTLYWRKETQA